MMLHNYLYSEIYRQKVAKSKEKIDKLLKEKSEDGTLDNIERLKLEEQRFLAPLFDISFSSYAKYRSPW